MWRTWATERPNEIQKGPCALNNVSNNVDKIKIINLDVSYQLIIMPNE